MENKLLTQLNDIDMDNIKLDAVIELHTWQKKMFSIIEKTYSMRLNEIDEILLDIKNEIKEKEIQLQQIKPDDKTALLKLQNEIDELQCKINLHESIPEDFHHLIEQTIRIKYDDEDDDLVIIDFDKHKGNVILVGGASRQPSINNQESRVSKILHSEPVQQALAVTLAKTLTHMGTIAATSTTTIAATTMAKTALFTTACGIGTVAYGMGRIAMGTTKRVWSFVVSSDDF